MDACVTPAALRQSLAKERPPLVIDVRREPAFRSAPDWLRGALRRDPEHVARWQAALPRSARVVVYCVHGHEVSQGVARELRARGLDAAYLDGGIEGWRTLGGELDAKAHEAASRWVTRERPKIDRIACPWLVRRFIDPRAEFLYVPRDAVMRVAAEARATPYDVPDVRLSHAGEHCSFDAFLAAFRLREPALDELARIVRGADTGRLDLAPQSAGLVALSSGLSRVYADDHEMLAHGIVMYDALYCWCKEGKPEAQTWNPERAP
jgi:rhodanese-related sulfurtransferase